ncbi:MAG: class I SAM-dependent methyltransferase [Actinomycetota bacterium]
MDRLLKEALLAYGPAFVGPALWAFATFPEKLRWTGEVSARVFSVLAGIYDVWTEVEGYGEPLEQAILDLRAAPERILDLATGTGYAARRLKERFPGAEVVGVDVSAEMVAIAEQDSLSQGLEISYMVGEVAALPFSDGSFDLVVQQNAMPFPDEIMRVVRPAGRALIILSVGGPWASLAWPALAGRLEGAGAVHVRSRRVGFGFYGAARKGGA